MPGYNLHDHSHIGMAHNRQVRAVRLACLLVPTCWLAVCTALARFFREQKRIYAVSFASISMQAKVQACECILVCGIYAEARMEP